MAGHGHAGRDGVDEGSRTVAGEALHDGWTVRAVGGDVPPGLEGVRIPATVPGCVHLDLMAAGLVPDPYLDENEAALTWIGRVDWRWETTFAAHADGDEHVDLVALGLDTVATVEVNGAVVARTANMHRSHRIPVAHLLGPGDNTLAVTIAAGRTAAERANGVLGPRPHVNAHPYNAIRTMACAFGWDWGPDAVTAGIWRPIGLDRWRGARIAALRPLVGVDGDTGRLTAHVDLERDDDVAGLTLQVAVGDAGVTTQLRPGETAATVEVEVPGVRLWWPRGYGAQPLYPVTVTVGDSATGRTHAVARTRVGFRTVELDTTPDEHGTPFTIVVNGEPVFARGVNWIPDDILLPRVTRERYRERITPAVEANVNLVRVWGGGIYESDDFYDACDELGVLVWQDFLFACAAYAEEEPLRGEVIAEAREAVTRLSPHPSLVLWNGGNENLWGHEDWGWKERLGDLSWGLGYYDDVLPGIVAELDPTRPYCPGSPWSPGRRSSPERPRARHHPPLGGLEPPRLRALPRRRPAVRLRVRLPGAAGLGHADPRRPRRSPPRRRPRAARPPEGRGRPGEARCAACAATCPSPRPSTTGTGPPRSTRRGRSRSASSTPAPGALCARARSCGSSTTAGRWSRGPPSTATAAASRSGTRCAAASPTACSPSSRGTAASRWSPSTTPPTPGRRPRVSPADPSTGASSRT